MCDKLLTNDAGRYHWHHTIFSNNATKLLLALQQLYNKRFPGTRSSDD